MYQSGITAAQVEAISKRKSVAVTSKTSVTEAASNSQAARLAAKYLDRFTSGSMAAKQAWDLASAAINAGNLSAALATLEEIRARDDLTPDQREAVTETMAAIRNSLRPNELTKPNPSQPMYSFKSKVRGDSRLIAALRLIMLEMNHRRSGTPLVKSSDGGNISWPGVRLGLHLLPSHVCLSHVMKIFTRSFCGILSVAIWFSLPAFARAEEVWLSSLDLSGVGTGWGEPGKDRSVDRRGLSIAGKKFTRRVGTHAACPLCDRVQWSAGTLCGLRGC